jgi:hypothetical protein
MAVLAVLLATTGAHADEGGRELAVMAWSGAAAGSAAAEAAAKSQRGCSSIVGCINEVQRQIAESGAGDGGSSGQASTIANAVLVVEVEAATTTGPDGTMTVKAKVTDQRLDVTANTPAATRRQIEAEARVVTRRLNAWSRTLSTAEVKVLLETLQLRLPVPEPFAELQLLSKPTLVLTVSAADQDKATTCSLLQAQRRELEQRLAELMDQRLPDERLDDLLDYLGMIREVAANTSEGAEKRAEQIRKVSETISPHFPRVGKALDRVVKGVGEAAEKLTKVVEFVDKVTPALEEAARIFREVDSGTAADQIRNLRTTFDAIRGTLPVNEVPGLGDLFDAYSQAMDGIATSVEAWEGAMRRFAAAAREADELKRDFVIRARGPREQRADAINKARQELAEMDQRLSDNGCSPPPPAPRLCDPPRPHVDRLYDAALVAAEPLRERIAAAATARADAANRVGSTFATRSDRMTELERLRSRITTWGGDKRIAAYRDMVSRAAALEAEIRTLAQVEADAQAEMFRHEATQVAATRRWRNAVQDELAKTVGWTSEDLDYLRFCKPERFLPGGGY